MVLQTIQKSKAPLDFELETIFTTEQRKFFLFYFILS